MIDNGASVENDISLESDEMEPLLPFHIKQVITYTLNKLMSGEPQVIDPVCNLRIFYPVCQQVVLQYLNDILLQLNKTLPVTYCMIPVTQLHNVNTILSISAMRHN